MPIKTLDATLSPENEEFIAQQIESGAFQSHSEVVNAGVQLLRQRSELLARLKEGRRQLDEGEYEDFDDAEMDEFFRELNERARQRSQNSQVAS